MLPAVEFDDETSLEADEIDDERANRCLAAESASVQLSAAQSRPQMVLGVCRISAQFLRSGSQHLRIVARVEFADSPPPQPSPVKGEGQRQNAWPCIREAATISVLPRMFRDQRGEALEEIVAVLRSGRSLGMVLHREHRPAFQPQSLVRAVEQ